MKSRLERARENVGRIFDGIEDTETRRFPYMHTYGVAQCCVLLALGSMPGDCSRSPRNLDCRHPA
jgi:hypothetical protein